MLSPSALQQAILSLLCFDAEHAQILALKLDAKKDFIGRSAQLIAKTAISYIQQYNSPPGSQLELLLESEIHRGQEGRLLGQTINLLKEQVSTLQPEFVLNELENYQTAQHITIAASEAIEAVSRGDIEEAKEFLHSADKHTENKFSNNEIKLSDPAAMLRLLDKRETDYISSGIEAIDSMGARPERKTVTIMVAPTGKGKTWFLINVAKSALQYKRSVLYVTLELSAEKVAGRLLQSIFSLTKSEAERIKVPYFIRDPQGNLSIQFRELDRDSLFNKREELQKKLSVLNSFSPLIIKEFPSGSLSLAELELYLDYLEKHQKFVPDVLALDYAQLMKLNIQDFRLSIGQLWVGLRGLASKRNLALVSASQGNKESDTAKTVDRGMVAEDWSQIGTADCVLTYSQTSQEKQLGLSRILVAKSRDNADRYMVLNTQSYTIGQFSIESTVFQRGVAQELERVANGIES